MKIKSKFQFVFVIGTFVITSVVLSSSSIASLGEPLLSIEKDQKFFASQQKRQVKHSKFNIHILKSPSAEIREYVSPSSGIVFAISWEGLIHPNLHQLLGRYADEYEKDLALHSPRSGSRTHSIKTSQIVVEKWGRMRNLKGRAYSLSLLPNGVDINEIE